MKKSYEHIICPYCARMYDPVEHNLEVISVNGAHSGEYHLKCGCGKVFKTWQDIVFSTRKIMELNIQDSKEQGEANDT